MATKKKRLPIEQLRETAKLAEEILRNKNIHTKNSTLAEIAAQNDIRLPGLPPYLPHRESLMQARRIMADLLIVWINETKGESAKREDHKAFFNFLVTEMARIEHKFKEQNDRMPEFFKALKGTVLLNKVFKPMQEMETAHTMAQFLIDSFNVFVSLHMDGDGSVPNFPVSDYIFWFDEWTHRLDHYWVGPNGNV
jgi:hypothetical protein